MTIIQKTAMQPKGFQDKFLQFPDEMSQACLWWG